MLTTDTTDTVWDTDHTVWDTEDTTGDKFLSRVQSKSSKRTSLLVIRLFMLQCASSEV